MTFDEFPFFFPNAPMTFLFHVSSTKNQMTVATYTCPAKSIARWSGPDILDFRQADGEDSWRTNIECLQNVTLRHLIYCIHFINPKGNLRTCDIAFCYGQTSKKRVIIFYYFHSTIGITTSMTTLHLGVSNRQFTANAPLKLLQLLSEGLRGYKCLTTKIWESQGFWFDLLN